MTKLMDSRLRGNDKTKEGFYQSRINIVIPAKAGIQGINIKPTGCRIKSGMTILLDSRLRTLKGIHDGNDKTKEVTFIA